MTPVNVRVFINYRHDDTEGEALLLYERLANRFGADNVFLDDKSLKPGMKWLEEIKEPEFAGSIPQLERMARQRVTRDLTAAEKKRYGIS